MVGIDGEVVDCISGRARGLRTKRKYLRGSGLLSGKYSQRCDGRQLDGGYLPYRDCGAGRKIDDSALMPEAHIVPLCLWLLLWTSKFRLMVFGLLEFQLQSCNQLELSERDIIGQDFKLTLGIVGSQKLS